MKKRVAATAPGVVVGLLAAGCSAPEKPGPTDVQMGDALPAISQEHETPFLEQVTAIVPGLSPDRALRSAAIQCSSIRSGTTADALVADTKSKFSDPAGEQITDSQAQGILDAINQRILSRQRRAPDDRLTGIFRFN